MFKCVFPTVSRGGLRIRDLLLIYSFAFKSYFPPLDVPPNAYGLERQNCPTNSDVVLETKVLVSRRLEDNNTSLGLDLGLDKKVLSIFKPFSSLVMTENYDIVV